MLLNTPSKEIKITILTLTVRVCIFALATVPENVTSLPVRACSYTNLVSYVQCVNK